MRGPEGSRLKLAAHPLQRLRQSRVAFFIGRPSRHEVTIGEELVAVATHEECLAV